MQSCARERSSLCGGALSASEDIAAHSSSMETTRRRTCGRVGEGRERMGRVREREREGRDRERVGIEAAAQRESAAASFSVGPTVVEPVNLCGCGLRLNDPVWCYHHRKKGAARFHSTRRWVLLSPSVSNPRTRRWKGVGVLEPVRSGAPPSITCPKSTRIEQRTGMGVRAAPCSHGR